MKHLRLLAVAVLATSLLTAAPAYAEFDPVPLACDARISPWEGRVVYSAYNPNDTSVFIDYGESNILLENPNFIESQPTVFPPGLSEGAFSSSSDPAYARFAHRTWYLMGTIVADTNSVCGGVGGPVNTAPPRLTGDPVAGQAVGIDAGTWSGGGAGGMWQTAWLEACGAGGCRRVGFVDSTPFDDTTHGSAVPASLPVPEDETGERLRVVVAAYSWRGVTQAASPLSVPVIGGTEPSAPDLQVVDGVADFTVPSVVGGAVVTPRSRLEWRGFPRPTLSFSWQRCTGGDCSDIPGANELSHRLVADDVGHSLRVRVTGTNASGSATSTTNAIGIDAAMPTATSRAVAIEPPSLVGTPRAGSALTVRPGSWVTTEPLGYQWQRCTSTCEDIGGADAASYVATAADTGSRLRAVVLATGAAGTVSDRDAVTRFSTEPSEPVVAAPVTPPTPVTPVTPPPTAPSPQAPMTGDEVAPRITDMSLTRWRASRGTVLRFTLSEAASLRIDVRRPHRARPWATLRRTVSKGSHQVRISVRIGQRRLPPGRYTLTVVATDASGNRSSPVTRRLTVVR